MPDRDDSGARRGFEPGVALSRRFFFEAVQPIVDGLVPGLAYGAALIGDGSEVLGFDDEISCDHDWGPRVLLFVSEGDFACHAAKIVGALETALPDTFGGWPTAFEDPDRPVGIDGASGSAASERHAVEIHVLPRWIERQIGRDCALREPSAAEWMEFEEQRLLSVVAGEIFRDDRGELAEVRARLGWYPDEVVRARLARLWSAAGSEMPFVGRAGHRGDEIGSRLIASRLAEHAVRITFLVDSRYAPYSKWLGMAWALLPSASTLEPYLQAALSSGQWQQREAALAMLFSELAQRQVEAGIEGALPPRIDNYHSRPFRIANADEIAHSLRAGIAAQRLREWSVGRS